VRVLILQQPTSSSPIDTWLREADPSLEIAIVSGTGTVRDEASLSPGVQRFLFDDYLSPATNLALMRICRSWLPDRIASNSEYDVLRAGRVRSILGVPGQKSQMALMFRDKVRMKQLFEAVGLAAVPYRAVQSVEDVLDALRDLGTIVLKPRQGAGSVGVQILEGEREARELLSGQAGVLEALEEGRLMAEELQTCNVYHVDIAAHQNRPLLISPSAYLAPPHTFRSRNVASVMLDEDSQEYHALCLLASDFVAGLPNDHGANLFHLEVYARKGGGYLAGEVACRLGGGLIKESIRHTYGIDLSRLGYLLATDLADASRTLERLNQQTGFVLWTATEPPPASAAKPEWCLRTYYSNRTRSATDSVDASARFLIAGRSGAEINDRIRDVECWGKSGIVSASPL
jgi:hypothetical protein